MTHSPHILVAEDDRSNARLTVAILKSVGYRVSIAHDGEEAVRIAQADEFSLILMDINMPRLDGLAATRQIRSDISHKRNIPILYLTGHPDIEMLERCADAGMDGYLVKPCPMDNLVGAVEQIVGKGCIEAA